MGYFQVRYDSRVIISKRKMIIRLATAVQSYFSLPVANLINNLRWYITTVDLN